MMLDIGLISLWAGLLLLQHYPMRFMLELAKSMVFFLLWMGAWYTISLVFFRIAGNYRPHEDYILLIERLLNISFSVLAFAVAWILVVFGFRKNAPLPPRTILLWISHLILWKLLIFNTVFLEKTPQTYVLGVSLALVCLYTIVQSLKTSRK